MLSPCIRAHPVRVCIENLEETRNFHVTKNHCNLIKIITKSLIIISEALSVLHVIYLSRSYFAFCKMAAFLTRNYQLQISFISRPTITSLITHYQHKPHDCKQRIWMMGSQQWTGDCVEWPTTVCMHQSVHVAPLDVISSLHP